MTDAIAVVVFVGAYVFIATEWVHRVIVALAGAGIMLLFRIVDAHDIFNSERLGIDWNVIFLLMGMMIIVGVLRQTGLFEFLAIWSARRSRGRPFVVLLLLVVITAVASALLDNVTTILLVAPVTVLLAERFGVPPAPFIVAEVLASNVGGTATLIGDPPNIIIGSAAGLSYTDFLANLAPLVVLLLVVFVALSRWLFRGALRFHPERVEEVLALDPKEALVGGSLLPKALGVLGVVTLAFGLQELLRYEPSVVALLGAGVLLLVAPDRLQEATAEIEWGTLLFFVGLFIMVGALVKVGVIEDLARFVIDVTNGDLLVATVLLVLVSAVLSAVVDNIPYVATMVPLVAALSAQLPGDTTVLWWALAIGADLGGNATSIGASANVVALGVAERSGFKIRFSEFLRYGVPTVAVTIGISLAYLWLRYFVLG
jgi:Na+/H+ antiporter NhaD/arsenite permease-like protein